ncbi:MAG: glycosyltransferase family 2 protein [Opitutaceae bacterium]
MSVSLIVPNCNNARFLPRCLASALGQSLPFEEIIVVDDASDDDSVDVVRAISSKARAVRLVERKQRGGVASARDTGIQAARGTHLTTIDADDFFWSAKKNEQEWNVITSYRGKRFVAAFSDVRRVNEDGGDLGRLAATRKVREGDVFWWLMFLRGFIPRDFTFSREAYCHAGGYDKSLRIYEDWDFKLRLSRICDFYYTGHCGVAYRANPIGLSNAPFIEHWKAMVHVAWKNTSVVNQPRLCVVRAIAISHILWFHRGRLKHHARQLLRRTVS